MVEENKSKVGKKQSNDCVDKEVKIESDWKKENKITIRKLFKQDLINLFRQRRSIIIILSIIVLFLIIKWCIFNNSWVTNTYEIKLDEKKCEELISQKDKLISNYSSIAVNSMGAFIETTVKNPTAETQQLLTENENLRWELLLQQVDLIESESTKFLNGYLDTMKKPSIWYIFYDNWDIEFPRYCTDKQVQKLKNYDFMIYGTNGFKPCIEKFSSDKNYSYKQYADDLINCSFDLNDTYWKYLLDEAWFSWDYEDLP